VVLLCDRLPAQALAIPPSNVLFTGEDLTYNVRYGFINLGQVRIKTISTIHRSSFTVHYTRALINSYPKVPFVDLHATYESMIDSTVHSRQFIGKGKENKSWDYAKYDFDYDKNRVLIELGHRDTVVERRDTLSINTPYHDGLSLFFYARDQLYSGKRMNIPTIVREKKVNTFIDFKPERTSVDVDAVDYPVDAIHFEGKADFVGIFGLTGEFEGWFSNDEARIPILAKMKVIIGSVTLELMEWKREGWKPPRAVG
jgi:hypothetical protein